MSGGQVRLGLPWRMSHYIPMNGPHPLVRSFVEGLPAVQSVPLQRGAVEVPALQETMIRAIAQARALPTSDVRVFVEWLDLLDQTSMEQAAERYDALFLHTTPVYAGTQPWIFHFESFPSLFMPFMYTGRTRGIDLLAKPWAAHVRAMLESDGCQRIFSHMRSSLEILQRVFDSPAIAAKCHHVPLGIAMRPAQEFAGKFMPGQPLRILFTNSLHGHPSSFYLRGGHHLLNAFAQLRRRVPDARLTILSAVPPDLLERFGGADFDGVDWLPHRLDDATLDGLFRSHQLFALPAAGLHSHSLLRAVSNGCVPLVSDALGYEEFVAPLPHSVPVLRGVREMVYRDEPGGWISDDYTEFQRPQPELAARLLGLLADAAADIGRLGAMATANHAHFGRHHTPATSHDGFVRMLVGRRAEPADAAPMARAA